MKIPGYNCFGCSPDNQHGLQMNFFEDGEFIIAEWEPKDFFQGYFNVLHGGIQATLIDEIASWFVYVKLKTSGITSKLEIRYKNPVYTDKGKITLKARLKEKRRNIVLIFVEIYNNEGKLCAYGDAQYFTYPAETVCKHLYYPEYDEFFYPEELKS